jgi:hypothetical protein
MKTKFISFLRKNLHNQSGENACKICATNLSKINKKLNEGNTVTVTLIPSHKTVLKRDDIPNHGHHIIIK